MDRLFGIAQTFRRVVPAADDWCLRIVSTELHAITVRRGALEPPVYRSTLGAYIACRAGDGSAYAATSDVSETGLAAAARLALERARALAGRYLLGAIHFTRPQTSGRYRTRVERPWEGVTLNDKIGLLQDVCRRLKCHADIVEWSASLHYRRDETLQIAQGCEIEQRFDMLSPGMTAVAHARGETQIRTYGYDLPAQAGLEHLNRIDFTGAAERVASEALELLAAPDCPSGKFDVLLMPSQMILQIHESIGHPLELDRILGDERNYAGRSFVTPDMFGSYRYGSPLLNVVFDPGTPCQIAAYAFDDEGTPAHREYLIKDGILLRPLGGACSQRRAGLPGVACGRASGWNRPPIDRMANINIEPGNSTLQQMIGRIRRGVLMDTNRSWSIDDHRNKFQFGCEYGRWIEDGELRGVVKNPNYRGISADFWRTLVAVGDAGTHTMHGVHACGKGEPNQAIHAGHASPACLFTGVEVFGGG